MLESTVDVGDEASIQNENSFVIKGVQKHIELQITPGVDFMKLRNDLERYFEDENNQKLYQGQVLVLQLGDYGMEWHQFEHLKHYLKTWSDVELVIHPDWSKNFFKDYFEQPSYLDFVEKTFDSSSEVSPNLDIENAVVIKNTLRAGSCVKHDETVIVLGDIHSSASVYSQKNVVVLGRIKGKTCAGMNGDRKSFIFGLQMLDSHLVIAGTEEDLKGNSQKKPAIAYLKQEKTEQKEAKIQIDPCETFHSFIPK